MHCSSRHHRALAVSRMSSSLSSSPAVAELKPVSGSQSETSAPILSRIVPLVPTMNSTRHKGQCGRIMTIGGSAWYTGAPYFASQTALLMGADLVTVITAHDAATVIKTYSPELMVRPLLVPEYALGVRGLSPFSALTRADAVDRITADVAALFDKSNAVCIGPGLGTDALVQETVAQCVRKLIGAERPIPFVCDGDGIAIFASDVKLLSAFKQCVFTPNAAEFRRLYAAFIPDSDPPPFNVELSDRITKDRSDGDVIPVDDTSVADTAKLASAMGGCIIVRKGGVDIISDGKTAMFCKTRGSPRRCGGQGDVLSGSVTTALAWWKVSEKGDDMGADMLSAVWLGCHLSRLCQRVAFDLHGRSMSAENVVAAMEVVIEQLFPVRGKL